MSEMKGALAAGVLGVVMAAFLFQAIIQLQTIPTIGLEQQTMAENTTVMRYQAATPGEETKIAPDLQGVKAEEPLTYVFTYPLVAGLSLAVAGLAYIILRRAAG